MIFVCAVIFLHLCSVFRKQPCPFCLVFLVVHWNEKFLVLHSVQWIVYLIPMLSGFLAGITGVTIHKLTQCCVCNTHSVHTCTIHTVYTHAQNMHTKHSIQMCTKQYIQYTGMHNTYSMYTHMHNTVYTNICTTYTVYAQLTQFTHLHDTHSVHTHAQHTQCTHRYSTQCTHMHNAHSMHKAIIHFRSCSRMTRLLNMSPNGCHAVISCSHMTT